MHLEPTLTATHPQEPPPPQEHVTLCVHLYNRHSITADLEEAFMHFSVLLYNLNISTFNFCAEERGVGR